MEKLIEAILAINESFKHNPSILAEIRELDPNLEDIINEAIDEAVRMS